MGFSTCTECGKENPEYNLSCSDCGAELPLETMRMDENTSATVTLPAKTKIARKVPQKKGKRIDLEQTLVTPTPGDHEWKNPLEPGQRLAHFEVVEKLGHGGMAAVYKARDLKLDRFAALKVIRLMQRGAAFSGEQLLKEAKMASALNHPNIVTIYDIIHHSELDFIAMEWVDGETLKDLIPPKGLSVQDTLNYALRIADGLVRAHRDGIIHRDIKPSNIMVTQDRKVKILDFGVAKLQGAGEWGGSDQPSLDRTTLGVLKGTLPYMSPEQARGQAIDARSDIFSFGVLVYRMLTGVRPFKGDDTATLVSEISGKRQAAIRNFRIDIPDGFSVLVDRCLEKDRKKRYQDMNEVVLALEGIQGELRAKALLRPELKPS